MKTMKQFTMKYRVSNNEDTMIIMAEDELSAITKFFTNAKGWADYELLSVEAGEGEYDAKAMTLVDESLDEEMRQLMRQPNCSGKFYAYSHEEYDRIYNCIANGEPIGRVAVYPTESGEIPEGGWLLYYPWGYSWNSKRFTNHREAVETLIDIAYTHWYERVNDL